MSEEPTKDSGPQEAEIEEFFNQGLHSGEKSNAGEDPSYPGGTVLEYQKKVSLEDARKLRLILSANTAVKKLSIWDISLGALRAAFDKLEDWGSLEELQILSIDCDGEDFIVDFSGAFKKLRVLDLRCDSITSAFAETMASYLRKSKSLQELSLWYSCGGDDGAAAIADALKANETLKKLTLAPDTPTLTSKTVVAIAEMLAVNSTLEMVDLFDTCSMEEEQLSFLFEQDTYADVFKRMLIVWKQEFLPQLTKLVREHRNYSQVSVSVTASVDKDHLREFFDAVATNTTLHVLHFYPSDKCFDELADGIACVVKRTATLKEVQNLMHVEEGCEQQLVRVLDAMRENHSVTTFTMYAELLTHEIAMSLSEMLAVNGTLCDVAVCEYWGIGSDIVGIILEGLRQNYTLTKLMVSWDPDDNVEGIAEMEELLKRNSCLLDQAVRFVTGECTDTEAADAAKKLRASGGLVDKLKELTGKTAEAVLCDIETAISGLSE